MCDKGITRVMECRNEKINDNWDRLYTYTVAQFLGFVGDRGEWACVWRGDNGHFYIISIFLD